MAISGNTISYFRTPLHLHFTPIYKVILLVCLKFCVEGRSIQKKCKELFPKPNEICRNYQFRIAPKQVRLYHI